MSERVGRCRVPSRVGHVRGLHARRCVRVQPVGVAAVPKRVRQLARRGHGGTVRANG